MGEHRATKEHGSNRQAPAGMPQWLLILLTLALLSLLVYNILVVGPEGYPTSVVVAGLLGGLIGGDQFLKNRRAGGGDG